MMVSFMPYLPSRQTWLRSVLVWVLSLGLWFSVLPAHAQQAPTLSGARFELASDAVRLSGTLNVRLSNAVQDTLAKGVPVFFVFETIATQDRWYWSDKRILTNRRYARIVYLPLLRKWRLNFSSDRFEAGVSKGVLMNQNYDSLNDAMMAMQRITNWKVLDRSDWDSDTDYNIEVRFRLDTSQLQRTLQYGTTGSSDWNLSMSRNLRLNAQNLGKVLN